MADTIDLLELTDDPAQAIDKINFHDHSGGGLGSQITTGGITDGAVTTAKLADGAVTAQKLADGTITIDKVSEELIDEITAASSGGTNAPGYYKEDVYFSASGKTSIASPNRLWLNIGSKGYTLEQQVVFDLTADSSWDSKAELWQAGHDYALDDVIYPSENKTGYYYRCTIPGTSSTLAPEFPQVIGQTYNDGNCQWICEYDNTVATNRKGKDFYIYACEPETGTTPVLMLSANSTVPLRYTASNSRKIGGFHTLCANVGTITNAANPNALSGYLAGDVLPASVWDWIHRPASEPEGMVYHDGLDVWVDIYLASWSGSYSNDPEDLKLETKFGALAADGTSAEKFHCLKFEQIFGRQKKRLAYWREFIVFSLGSNQSTNVAGGADVNTTGGFSDTAGRRMISSIGCEDCCGNLWQWGADVGSATTGGSNYANYYDANDKYVGGQTYGAVYRPVFGGDAHDGVHCGSRASVWINGALALDWDIGARGVAEPKRLA